MTLQYPLSFLALAASCGGIYWITGHTRWWWVGAIAIWAGSSFVLLALMYAINWCGPLGKRRTGGRWFWAWPVFWPYFLLCELSFAMAKSSGQVTRYSEVAPGLILGRRKSNAEAETVIREFGIRGVVDLAAEFGESTPFREVEYLSLPALDAMPPNQHGLQRAVEWIDRVRQEGPVYLHCALGHGRAATLAAAYLVYSGLEADYQAAIRRVRSIRPGVKLNDSQRAAVAAIRKRA